jgi:hypothetical protein
MFDDNEFWSAAEIELEHDRQEAEADAKNGCWTRKDGSKIHVSEMSTDYIKNCIRYINRTDVYDVMLPYCGAKMVNWDGMEGEAE